MLHGGDVAPWAEAALYAASRAQHVEQLIRPALARGATVICDRYVDSSVAYQGIARGLGLERVLELNLAAVGGLMPDRTILLEIGADDAVARMGGDRDRIEREDDGFHARVAAAYRRAGRAVPDAVPGRRRHRGRPRRSPRRSMEPFAAVPEQYEAKRLLTRRARRRRRARVSLPRPGGCRQDGGRLRASPAPSSATPGGSWSVPTPTSGSSSRSAT